MAYDRDLAVRRPTYSTAGAGPSRGPVGVCCSISYLNALTHTLGLSLLDLCDPHLVNHFYCDLPPLLQLCCSSPHLNGQLLFVGASVMGVIPMVLISVSYAHEAAAVLRIRSAQGRKKAVATCGSHSPWSVSLWNRFFRYMRLGSVSASDKDEGIGILNTILNPMLNPLICSLQNPDAQGALKQVLMERGPQ